MTVSFDSRKTGIIDPAAVAITGGTINRLPVPSLTLPLPNRLNFRQVMATPPTTTFLTTNTITTPLSWPSVSATGAGTKNRIAGSSFNYCRAGGPVIQGTNYPDYSYVRFTNVNYGGGSLQSGFYQVSFMHDGSELEISVKSTTGQILVKVDDQYISLTPQTVANDGSLRNFYIQFGSRKLRRIDAIIYGAPFGGVYTGQNDTIFPAPVRGPRTIILGDSFTEGTGAATQALSWSAGFADAMGWDDVWASGVGSTGYLATVSAKVKYRDRVAGDVIAFRPDVVMVTGGINDNGSYTGAQVGTEAAALFAQIAAALPNTLIVAVAPFWKGGAATLPKNIIDMKEALRTAVQANRGLYLDPLEQPLPLNLSPQTTTLSASISIGAATLTVADPPAIRATYKFTNGERYQAKSASGAGPFTITLDSTVATAHTAGEVITQVGDCLWTGTGRVGSTTGYGNVDLYVSSDSTHPAQAGHDAIGQCVASLFIRALAP